MKERRIFPLRLMKDLTLKKTDNYTEKRIKRLKRLDAG
jgi:hypothetical protein